MKRFYSSVRIKLRASVRGQAAAEFAVVAPLLLVIICGAIDFGRALNDVQIMADLTRQGSNLASRGTPLNESYAAVVSGESGLDLVHCGEVISTSVTNENGTYKISGQDSSTADGLTKLSATRRSGPELALPRPCRRRPKTRFRKRPDRLRYRNFLYFHAVNSDWRADAVRHLDAIAALRLSLLLNGDSE